MAPLGRGEGLWYCLAGSVPSKPWAVAVAAANTTGEASNTQEHTALLGMLGELHRWTHSVSLEAWRVAAGDRTHSRLGDQGTGGLGCKEVRHTRASRGLLSFPTSGLFFFLEGLLERAEIFLSVSQTGGKQTTNIHRGGLAPLSCTSTHPDC